MQLLTLEEQKELNVKSIFDMIQFPEAITYSETGVIIWKVRIHYRSFS